MSLVLYVGVWQRANLVMVTRGIICSNVGICYCLLTGLKTQQWRVWLSTSERMQNYWGVEAATQIYLRFSFVVRSFGVALCWSSKDYWCQKEVPARSFLAVGKTLVIITILIMVLAKYPWHSSVLHRCQAIWLDWGTPGWSFYPSYCTISPTCLCSNLGWVCVFFSAEFNFTVSFFDLYLYIKACHWNK